MSCVSFSQNSATHVWPDKNLDLGGMELVLAAQYNAHCQVAAMLCM